MFRVRLTGAFVTLGLLIGGGAVLRGPAGVRPFLAASRAARPAVRQVFYTSPVLVREGERVRVPVDVVCATAQGAPCDAAVIFAARAGSGRWQQATVPAAKGLQFDVTAPASRALAPGAASGRVDFYLRARDAFGHATTLGSERRPLSFYVTNRLPVLRLPTIPFGKARRGRTVLSLPWGSGPTRAGLAPGLESATLGPSSFDVDSTGRVYLVDPLQDRVVLFRDGRLVRETEAVVGPRAEIAVASDGHSFVADATGAGIRVREMGRGGRLVRTTSLGEGLAWHIRATGRGVFVNVLPRDVWVPVSGGPAVVGMPTARGSRLLRLGTERYVRLAMVRHGAVSEAVEVRSALTLGEVALAEPDGHGGYVLVVHVWRADPRPADEYRVVHLRNGRVVETFAVANTKFAATPPLSRFRLGRDGALYQLGSTPSALVIERFGLAGMAR